MTYFLTIKRAFLFVFFLTIYTPLRLGLIKVQMVK